MRRRPVGIIERVILHHSASAFGDVDLIRSWHLKRGFEEVGYHFIITNGKRTAKSKYDPSFDGILQYGRALHEVGAHCRNQNGNSVGICMVGNGEQTDAQWKTLSDLFDTLLSRCSGLNRRSLYVHRQFDQTECPGFDREYAQGRIAQVKCQPSQQAQPAEQDEPEIPVEKAESDEQT